MSKLRKKPAGPKVAAKRRKAAAKDLERYLDWYASGGDTPAPGRKRNAAGLVKASARRRAAVDRRVSEALKKFIRTNPAMPAAFKKAKAVALRRNANGSVTIRVVKVKPVTI